MTTFRDNEGRQWTLRISVHSVLRLRDEIGVDLLDPKQYRMAASDLVQCARVVFRCLVENATRKVTEDEFLASLYGDVLEEMRNAFGAAVVRFFPTSLQAATEGATAQTPQAHGTESSGGVPVS